ncbi:MAG: hypothetical protein JNL05_01080 [Flavobacteriales bacterium]|nr:hypothetical protein [Flavobacteriales bacterium]
MKPLALLLAPALLLSCSDPVQVTVACNDQRPVVFDGSDTLVPRSVVDSIALDPNGLHSCTTASGRTVEFRLGARPGLLNLDSSTFVVFTVDYRSSEKDLNGPQIIVGHVLVDSFLVYRKPFPDSHLDDSTAVRIAARLRADGNYAEAITPFGRRPLQSYARTRNVAGVRAIGPEEVFVERFWDFDLGQEIPSSITVAVNKGLERIDTERQRTAIMESHRFLVFASLSPEVYEVIDLRRSGPHDKDAE